MKVAIAVPSRDHGRFLPAALESLFTQEAVGVAVAVLDAGSRDDTGAVLRRYEPRLAYWRSAPDDGQAAAINEGIARLGASDYVGWLNADDVLLPGALSALAAYLDAHPECVAVHGQAHIIAETGRVVGDFPSRPFARRSLARTSIICQPASLVRRAAWNAVGGVDATLHMCMDYDLWWRLSARGAIGFVRRFVACSRDHEDTKTRAAQDRMYHEAFAILRRHLGYVPWRWYRSEAGFRWRATHGGRRARGPLERLACGCRAAHRYVRDNGASGLVRALRGPGGGAAPLPHP